MQRIAERLIDRLFCVQLDDPEKLVRKTYYELLNSWNQKRFGRIPNYTIDGKAPYYCTLRFEVSDNDKDIRISQLLWAKGETCSKAREHGVH